jgi:hypothetical protein
VLCCVVLCCVVLCCVVLCCVAGDQLVRSSHAHSRVELCCCMPIHHGHGVDSSLCVRNIMADRQCTVYSVPMQCNVWVELIDSVWCFALVGIFH